MNKWPYQAATSTWSTWAPGRLATSPSSRCFWPRTASPLAWWKCTWWWPSWADSSRSPSRPSPTSPTPSSGIRQTPTIRRSLAWQRLWVSSRLWGWRLKMYDASVGSLLDTCAPLKAVNLSWTFGDWFSSVFFSSQVLLLLTCHIEQEVCNLKIPRRCTSKGPWGLCLLCVIF